MRWRTYKNSDLTVRDGCREPARTGFLESFLYLDVAEPAFDRVKRFVVAVLKGGGYKRRIEIEHVLQTKGNRVVIQPSAPSTGIVLSSGDLDGAAEKLLGALSRITG